LDHLFCIGYGDKYYLFQEKNMINKQIKLRGFLIFFFILALRWIIFNRQQNKLFQLQEKNIWLSQKLNMLQANTEEVWS